MDSTSLRNACPSSDKSDCGSTVVHHSKLSSFAIMDVLLSISDVLGRRVLTDWLDLKHVVLLDRAYLSTASRALLLTLIRMSQFEKAAFKRMRKLSHIGYCAWLAQRSATTRAVTLPIEAFENLTKKLGKFTQACCSKLTEVEFSRFDDQGLCVWNVVNLVLPHCPKLLSLSIDNCGGYKHTFWRDLAQMCPEIQSITLQNLGRQINIDESAIAAVFPALQSLTLGGVILSTEFFISLPASTPQLRRLTCSKSPFRVPHPLAMSDMWFGLTEFHPPVNIPEEMLMHILQHNHEITSLELESHGTDLTDATLHCIATHCTKLKKLTLASVVTTNAGLSALFQHCTLLTELKISDHRSREVALMMHSIATHCNALEKLDISNCMARAADLTVLANGCAQLKQLHICAKVGALKTAPFKSALQLFDQMSVTVHILMQ